MPADPNDLGDGQSTEEVRDYGERFNRANQSELAYASYLRWMPAKLRAETGFDRFLTLLGAVLLVMGIIAAVVRHFWS